MSVSRTGDAIVEQAKECYELGLINVLTLERVTVRAEQPGYSPIMDLPFSWEIDEARRLARTARRPQKRRLWRRA